MSGKFLHSTAVTFIPAVLARVAIRAARNLPLVAGLKVTTLTDGVAVTVTVGAGVVEAHPVSSTAPIRDTIVPVVMCIVAPRDQEPGLSSVPMAPRSSPRPSTLSRSLSRRAFINFPSEVALATSSHRRSETGAWSDTARE